MDRDDWLKLLTGDPAQFVELRTADSFRYLDLSGCDLRKADLSRVLLNAINFALSDLRECRIHGSVRQRHLPGLRFSRDAPSRARIERCTFCPMRFPRSDLR